MAEELPVPLVRAWSMISALKKLGFKDDELVVGAVRTLPGVKESGVAPDVDPRKAYYAVAVVASRNGSTLTIPVSEWPMEPDAVRVAWGMFKGRVSSGGIAKEVLAKAAAKYVFDAQELEKDCRDRGLL